ncbi:MAG: hypothetical protein R2909_02255 [Gemmatimonadales bacterium]
MPKTVRHLELEQLGDPLPDRVEQSRRGEFIRLIEPNRLMPTGVGGSTVCEDRRLEQERRAEALHRRSAISCISSSVLIGA